MCKKIRDNMFYIGIIIFCLTMFFEQLFLGETNLTCFLKGFACGLEILGAFILIKNKKKWVKSMV